MSQVQGFGAQMSDGLALTMPQGWELIIILALVFVLFGAKKMPDAARGLGRSLRILKAETKGLRDDDADAELTESVGTADGPGTKQLPDAADEPSGVAAERRSESATKPADGE